MVAAAGSGNKPVLITAAVPRALVWFRKTTPALDGKAGLGARAAIDPVAPEPDLHQSRHRRAAEHYNAIFRLSLAVPETDQQTQRP